MKLSKIFLIFIFTILMAVDLNASRIKKDLLSQQEGEITSLLKEKITIVDNLIEEAKIYQNEKDPIIEKDFYNRVSGLVTQVNKRRGVIQTNNDTSSLVKKPKKKGYLGISSNKIGAPSSSFYSPNKDRDILGIKMSKRDHITTSYSNNINYVHILGNKMIKGMSYKTNISRKEFAKMIEKNLEKEIQPLTTELLEKYIQLIKLLSKNDINRVLTKLVKNNKAQSWTFYTKAFLFRFSSNMGHLNKKKTYNLSLMLDDTFKKLSSREEIDITSVPSYYEDRRIKNDFQCLESAEAIKYKGRICINPIDVDKDNYFKIGVFETRENNFLQSNRESFNTLKILDKKLEKASQDYIDYLILKLNTPEQATQIDLSGGL